MIDLKWHKLRHKNTLTHVRRRPCCWPLFSVPTCCKKNNFLCEYWARIDSYNFCLFVLPFVFAKLWALFKRYEVTSKGSVFRWRIHYTYYMTRAADTQNHVNTHVSKDRRECLYPFAQSISDGLVFFPVRLFVHPFVHSLGRFIRILKQFFFG